MTAPGMKVKRNVVLTGLLVLLAVFQLWGVYRGLMVWNSLVSHGRDNWELPLAGAALGVLAIVAIVGVWLWRRWGCTCWRRWWLSGWSAISGSGWRRLGCWCGWC